MTCFVGVDRLYRGSGLNLTVIENGEWVDVIDFSAGKLRRCCYRLVRAKIVARYALGSFDENWRFAFHEFDVKFVIGPLPSRKERLQEADIGRSAFKTEFRQGPRRRHGRNNRIAGIGMNDHFRQHRIIARACLIAGIPEMIDTDARTGRWLEGRQVAAAGARRSIRFHGF